LHAVVNEDFGGSVGRFLDWYETNKTSAEV
jgi:hypothetical protein